MDIMINNGHKYSIRSASKVVQWSTFLNLFVFVFFGTLFCIGVKATWSENDGNHLPIQHEDSNNRGR